MVGWAWGGGSDQNCFRDATFFAFFCVSGGLFPPCKSPQSPPLALFFSLSPQTAGVVGASSNWGLRGKGEWCSLFKTLLVGRWSFEGKTQTRAGGGSSLERGEGRPLHAARQRGAGGMPRLGYRVCRGFCGARGCALERGAQTGGLGRRWPMRAALEREGRVLANEETAVPGGRCSGERGGRR